MYAKNYLKIPICICMLVDTHTHTHKKCVEGNKLRDSDCFVQTNAPTQSVLQCPGLHLKPKSDLVAPLFQSPNGFSPHFKTKQLPTLSDTEGPKALAPTPLQSPSSSSGSPCCTGFPVVPASIFLHQDICSCCYLQLKHGFWESQAPSPSPGLWSDVSFSGKPSFVTLSIQCTIVFLLIINCLLTLLHTYLLFVFLCEGARCFILCYVPTNLKNTWDTTGPRLSLVRKWTNEKRQVRRWKF